MKHTSLDGINRMCNNDKSEDMKKLTFILFMAFAMMLSASSVLAQDKMPKQRLTREQLAEVQARHIVHELALDEATGHRFTSVYMACQKEVWALGPRLRRNATVTEAENEELIQQRFERSEKLLAIRRKYYAEYSKFLTQRQIQRVYEIEKKMMRHLAERKQSAHGKGRNHRK